MSGDVSGFEIDHTQAPIVGGRVRTWGSFVDRRHPRAGWRRVTMAAFQRVRRVAAL